MTIILVEILFHRQAMNLKLKAHIVLHMWKLLLALIHVKKFLLVAGVKSYGVMLNKRFFFCKTLVRFFLGF